MPGPARAAALDRAVRLVALELGAVAAMAGCERVLGLVRQLVGLRLGIDLNVRILEKAEKLSLRHFEDATFYDKLTRARREASTRPLSLIQSNFQVIRHGLTLAGYVALLIRFSGWMALAVLVATVPAFIAEARFSGAAFRLRNWRSPDSRRLTYLEYVLGNDEHAKEVKLFGLAPLLLGRYRRLAESFFADDRRLAVRRMAWGYALSLLSTVVFYGCYAMIVAATVRGRLSLGDMTLYLVAFRQGQQSFQAVLAALGGMYEDTLYMSNLFDYFAIDDGGPEGDRAGGGRARRGRDPVRGRRLQVSGGGDADGSGASADKWALRNVDVFVPKGQSLALVGENGAGKTTFIKLLAGLYDPTEGRVLLDGRDVRAWDERELRARIGVIFQDFNEYQLALRENVAFGSVDHLDDELRVGRAVDQGGAKELVVDAGGGPGHAARALVRGWRRAVGRAVAEGGARARVHARGGRHPDPRRADGGAGRRGRARRVPAFPRARGRAHHDPDLAPVPDRAHGGPHPGARSGARDRGRQPRRAARRRPPLRPPVRVAGRRLSVKRRALTLTLSRKRERGQEL